MMWMLRRKTDPKTRKHTLCEPAQSNAHGQLRRAILRGHLYTGKMLDPNPGDIVSCEPAQSKRTWTFHKIHFVWKFTGKMPDADSAASILCEPAQSKCTWTCHKSHFVWKFTEEMQNAPDTVSINERPFTLAVRTPSVWPHCLGNITNNTMSSPVRKALMKSMVVPGSRAFHPKRSR